MKGVGEWGASVLTAVHRLLDGDGKGHVKVEKPGPVGLNTHTGTPPLTRPLPTTNSYTSPFSGAIHHHRHYYHYQRQGEEEVPLLTVNPPSPRGQ